MSWTKKRERLHEAAVSTIRAISNNKKISSNTGLSQRPPTSDHVALPNVPRSFKDLNKWRGESDFQAFWHLFHKKSKDFQLTLPARMIFNELEIARVELLGSSKYLGSERNISEYTNSRSNELEDEKSLNFLSYGANLWLKEFMNFDLSENSKNIISKFIKKYKIDASANKIRENLIKNLDDQVSFEKNAIQFLQKLDLVKENVEDEENNFEEAPGSTDDIVNEEETTQEDSGIEEKIDLKDFDGDLNVDIQDAIENIDDTSIEDEIESLTYPNNDFQTSYIDDYSIYTSNFDEIIDAKDLVTNEESMRLRNQLDNLIKPHISTIGKLANRLQRLLLAKQNTSWNFNLEEGILDNSRLHRVIASPGYPLSFKQETENDFKDTIVTLLIDNSGSMRGRSISLAAICADIIGSTLERCQVKTEILGFTTKHWKGGDSKKLWIINGSRSNPGRLNDIRHIIYKSADNSWRRSRKYFGAMLREGLLKENVDGEALAWSHDRLLKRHEERKILIVISDGAPVDDSTLSANREDFLDNHLREIISKIEKDSPVELQAIGIGHDVTKYYKNALTINRAEELGEVLLEELTKLFKD
ncbi:MAG: aerobic cobaltochelatase subunit CobT [SAR86 cluster bacterium SAR86A]|jgi:cobaltochelatase CobT|uniref:Aerobic cobaltochelatase subunit CobT n=1 Tax=SAR86 cluster bacterium SAR86A TaxID=1123866 RepID=J4WNA7_9GAMM|nr:MAG: aerobic cobaltochelatase subunit CobT [SAR86 cluster bacterium SAR86A]GIR74527.1 MAG: cobaltochelatase subunit CobT [Prochlorococcus sp.]|tara:strand:+ start:365 stop:2128 length:1764 start_codon:yes stop_codon:yes gene_type:complete